MLQLAINMTALGAAYALVAMGFVLILNATNAVNFAHGALVIVGSYVAFTLGAYLPVWGLAILPLLLCVCALVGLVLSVLAYFPLQDKPVVAVFISTISAAAIFENAALLIFGAAPKTTPPLLGTSLIKIGDAVVSEQSVAVIVAAVVLITGQHLLFARTRLGKRLRAVAQDPEMAAACGINVRLMIAFTFALAAALAGAAGMLLSATYYVSPTDAGNYTMKAYIAATIGGWGSIPGAVVGAFMVAFFEVIIPALPALAPGLARWSPSLSSAFSMTTSTIALFVAFLVVLLFRPQGLFGEAIKKRA
jgi:branched-chain amino acid transport system permease protein